MTYDATEKSIYSGSPVELYLFDRAGVVFWSYTSADTAQVYGGKTYSSIPIQRSKIEQSQDIQRSALTLSMPSDTPLLDPYISAPPTDIINLTVRRFHESDGEVAVIWSGRLVNVEFNGYTAEIRCESVLSSLLRPVGRRLYQVNCPHVLYGDQCGVNAASFQIRTTLTGVSGLTITSPDFGVFADGHFTGGVVDFTEGGLITKRFVDGHTGNVLTLNLALTGAYVGATVDAFPGCNRTTDHCNGKFGNLPNYGGQPFYPGANPFSSRVF